MGYSATCAKGEPAFNRVYSGTAAQADDDTVLPSIHHPADKRSLSQPREQVSLCFEEDSETDLSLTASPLLPFLQFFKYFPHIISDHVSITVKR